MPLLARGPVVLTLISSGPNGPNDRSAMSSKISGWGGRDKRKIPDRLIPSSPIKPGPSGTSRFQTCLVRWLRFVIATTSNPSHAERLRVLLACHTKPSTS
jgi:hypothetical protein